MAALSTMAQRATPTELAGSQPREAGVVRLSVVIPAYNEQANVAELHARVRQVLDGLDSSSEIIFVDDGSSDATFARLSEIAAADMQTRVLRLRRNFGQTAALAAGIDIARGNVLIFLDSDLQNDPVDIPRFLAKIDEGYDVVSGWRRRREDDFLTRRLPSQLANALISRVTGVKLHDYGCTMKAYKREVLQNVRLYGEMHRFIPAFAAWVGASFTEIEVTHHPRIHGRSKYGLGRTFNVIFDLITVKFLSGFSTKPLYFFGRVGLALFFISFLCATEVLVEKFGAGTYAHRNPFLLLGVFIFALGMLAVMLGLVAEMLIRTYHESQDRPIYFVRETRNLEDARPRTRASASGGRGGVSATV